MIDNNNAEILIKLPNPIMLWVAQSAACNLDYNCCKTVARHTNKMVGNYCISDEYLSTMKNRPIVLNNSSMFSDNSNYSLLVSQQ